MTPFPSCTSSLVSFFCLIIGNSLIARAESSCPPPATEVHVCYEVTLYPLSISAHIPENSNYVFGQNFTTEITDAPTFLETLVYDARTVEVRSTCVLTSSTGVPGLDIPPNQSSIEIISTKLLVSNIGVASSYATSLLPPQHPASGSTTSSSPSSLSKFTSTSSSSSVSSPVAALHIKLDYTCNVLVCAEQEYDCSSCADRLNIDRGCYQRCLELGIAWCEIYQQSCPRQYKQGRSQCVNLNLEAGYCFDGSIEECEKVRSDCEIQNNDPGLAYVHPL